MLKEADLALLQLDRPVGEPLEATETRPSARDKLEVIAFFLGMPSLDNKTLVVTFGSDRLKSLLPAKARQELRRSTINLEMKIVRLDGHLLPGASGAPLVTSDGRVAAIGIGGLKGGAASISWAMAASYLNRLHASSEQISTKAVQSAELFMSPSVENVSRRFSCGELEFVLIGTQDFEELKWTTDDWSGLSGLLYFFSGPPFFCGPPLPPPPFPSGLPLPPPPIEPFEYKIYAPIDPGTAIAIPTWMEVKSHGDFCEASDGRFAIEFSGIRITGDRQSYPTFDRIRSENRLRSQFQRRSGYEQWRWRLTEPSYVGPFERFDGLIVDRKTIFVGPLRPYDFAIWAFETMMSKDDTLVFVIGVDWQHDIKRQHYCGPMPAAPGCYGIEEESAKLSQTILGVHLSTFPIY